MQRRHGLVNAEIDAVVKAVADPQCRDAGVLSRLESNPPAGLYGAPPTRQKSVIRNPQTLSKLGVSA